MAYFNIKPNVHYLRIEGGYIIDCIKYEPKSSLYQRFEGVIPPHIHSRCYKLISNNIVADQTKLNLYLQEVSDNGDN